MSKRQPPSPTIADCVCIGAITTAALVVLACVSKYLYDSWHTHLVELGWMMFLYLLGLLLGAGTYAISPYFFLGCFIAAVAVIGTISAFRHQ